MSEPAKRPGWVRLLFAGALVALVPKCLACVAGYLVLGAGLADRAPEWCGAGPAGVTWPWGWFVGTAAFLGGAFWLLAGQRVRGDQNGENTRKQSS